MALDADTRQGRSGNTSSTCTRATCRRTASAGHRRRPILKPATSTRSAAAREAIALSRDGKLLWSRSFGEEFAAFTTHGGRTMSPVVDGDLVIVSAAVSNWGTSALRGHRFIALDKRTGDVVYVANPGGRPYDTAYASPIIATINGMRLLIAGLGDGGVHAIKTQTGEKVWSFSCPSAPSTPARSFAATTCSCRTATRTSRATSSG